MATVLWAPLRQLCPDVELEQEASASGAPPAEQMGLALIDPDGESHIYVFSEDGRQALVKQLTGGVILPML